MKRLERSRSDRAVLGVCGGFGQYFGIDAEAVRVAWIALTLWGGVGAILYVAAIFLIPEQEPAAQEEVRPDRTAKNLGLLLIALGGVAFLRTFDWNFLGWGFLSFWNGRILVALLFAAAGAFLVWPRTRAAVGMSADRKLRRSVSNRVLAGVAGGFGEEAGVDANLIRIAFVFLAIVTSGLAVLLYLVLILVLPEEEVAVAPPPPVPGVAGGPSPPAASEGDDSGTNGHAPNQDTSKSDR